jgi:CheY-like chemotaxis protein
MGFRIVIADSNAKFMSMLGRALLDSDYSLYPAESKETALQQITQFDIDACIIDVDLPGGIEEVLQACMSKSKPIVAMGASTLKDTGKLVEIMYYGIPYVKKFNAEGDAKLEDFFYYMGLAAEKTAPHRKGSLPLLTPEFLPGIRTFARRYFESLFDRLRGAPILLLDNYQEIPEGSPFHAVAAHGLEAVPPGMQEYADQVPPTGNKFVTRIL